MSPGVDYRVNKVVKQGSLAFNVKDYGAKGDGTTDDTTAIANAITAATAIAGTFGALASPSVYFPGGRYIDNGTHALTHRIRLRGDGDYQTILYRQTGATGDFLTFSASHAGIEHLTVDGGGASSGDNVVLDASYTFARNARSFNGAGNGITIGKTAGAINHNLANVVVQNNKGYGIQTLNSGSTDGMWTNVNVGQSGKSGVILTCGSQNLVNVHSWGNGIWDSADNDGFRVPSSGNLFTNCESETNLGRGLRYSNGTGNRWVGGSMWGNCFNGVYGFGPANRNGVVGANIFNNGVLNTSGTSSTGYANICSESSSEWNVAANSCYDDGAAIPAGSYSTTPTYPYPGRTAQLTVSYHYAETNVNGVPDHNVLSGNIMRKERTRTGNTVLLLGPNNKLTGNDLGAFGGVVAKSANYTATIADTTVLATGGASGITVTLPAVALNQRLEVKKVDNGAGAITVSPPSGTIDGAASDSLSVQYASHTYVSDGTNWFRVV